MYSKQRALVAANIMQKNTKVFSNKNIIDVKLEVLVVIELLNLDNVFIVLISGFVSVYLFFTPILFLARYPPFLPPLEP